jgi:hypothetical protein
MSTTGSLYLLLFATAFAHCGGNPLTHQRPVLFRNPPTSKISKPFTISSTAQFPTSQTIHQFNHQRKCAKQTALVARTAPQPPTYVLEIVLFWLRSLGYWFPAYRVPRAGRIPTNPWATSFPMSAASRLSSRLFAVRFQHNRLVVAVADSKPEGEQFANAYFTTEIKIKMLVPPNIPLPHSSRC